MIVVRAELVTEGRFCNLYAASGAVYHFQCNCYAVKLCPQGGGFLAQGVIVRERCGSGIAFFAVQSAAARSVDSCVILLASICTIQSQMVISI